MTPFHHSMALERKKAWGIWLRYPEVIDTFLKISSFHFEMTCDEFAVLERLIILVHDKKCISIEVKTARRLLFAKTARQIDHIPPTKEALLQHCRRAVYQGGHTWNQADNPIPNLPSPSNWSWQQGNGQWKPLWTILPEASFTCQELKCQCKKDCKTKRCKCKNA